MATVGRRTLMQKRERTLIQVFYIFVLPVLFLYFDIIPESFRVPVLLTLCGLMYAIIRHERWPKKKLGIQKVNHQWIAPYMLFTIAGVVVLISLARELGYAPAFMWWKNLHFVLLFVPVSVFQEFAFRGFLTPLLKELRFTPTTVVIISAVLFTLIHIIYPPLHIAVPLALLGGVAFALIYERYPNLFLISIAHIILNFVAVLYGFFVIQ